MNQERYDIEAGRNILNMLKAQSPTEYDRLLQQLMDRAPGTQLGQAQENQPGFWDRLFAAGAGALTTIADYKLAEQTNKAQQGAYDEAVATEMQRQAMLAARAKSQALEFQNQMELTRQTAELQRAAERAKSRVNWALVAVGGLVGLWVLYKVAA